MSAGITIVGQGLAGTLLAWELERHGADFTLFDHRSTPASSIGCASMVAAGIVNPITGQRLVKSWRVDELLPLARETYRSLEKAWGISVWRDFRVRRLWANDDEKRIFAAKQARGELAPFGGAADADGFWIEQAGVLDVPALLLAARQRWLKTGRLITGTREALPQARTPNDLTIWCTGAALRSEPAFAKQPWAIAKGELLKIAVPSLDPAVILNRGHWVLPTATGEAKVGATYMPGAEDEVPSAVARRELERSAAQLLLREFTVSEQQVGLRLTVVDKHPVAGRLPSDPATGVLGGLGSKGVLLVPWLARQWWNHLSEGVPFDPAVDVNRFEK